MSVIDVVNLSFKLISINTVTLGKTVLQSSKNHFKIGQQLVFRSQPRIEKINLCIECIINLALSN